MNVGTVVAIGCLAVLLFDTLGATASRSLGFQYARLAPGSYALYVATSVVAAHVGPAWAGVAAGAILALVDATVGWPISWWIGPGRPPAGIALSRARLVRIVAGLTLTGAGFGLFGAIATVLARWSSTTRLRSDRVTVAAVDGRRGDDEMSRAQGQRSIEMKQEDKNALDFARNWVHRSPGPDSWANLAAAYATTESPDPKRARQWYRRAALKGHPRGLFEYGLMLIQGEGGPKRPSHRRRTLRTAATAKRSTRAGKTNHRGFIAPDTVPERPRVARAYSYGH